MPLDARPCHTKETSSPACYDTYTYTALDGTITERRAATDVITLNLGCRPLAQSTKSSSDSALHGRSGVAS